MFEGYRLRALFNRLRASGMVLATAESLTGGMIGAFITNIPGASDVYWGGIVSYRNDAKSGVLGVASALIDEYGVVSQQCAEAMACGVLKLSGADISVAVTGVAGPGGGTKDTPVGIVWITTARVKSGQKPDLTSKCLSLIGSRAYIRSATVRASVSLLIAHLDRK